MHIKLDQIEDKPGYEKYYRIPAIYYAAWLKKWGGDFSGSKVLDFGCGEGLVTCGLSEFCGAKEVVGVDISTDYLRCNQLLKEIDESLDIPGNVSFKKVNPVESLGSAEFDVIVSWSVLEHVAQDVFDEQLRSIYDALKDGGHCIFQIAPLFYSPRGSHLFGAHEPWEHLSMQTDLLYKKLQLANFGIDTAKGMWSCFETLNKFTDDQLVKRIDQSGLRVIDKYETYVSEVPSTELLQVYNKDILTKEQILLVCKK